ncbi:FecCD family ABC transporter permease [Chengkuizengella sediminis]|uniref:FecCD family ABC transporter permease n=1 Tax=Chengkuizengella sediminis TaxID=1885917 RepID=UPI001389D31B|nr:iron ABC transporter permease [Chengkuizengella sediminis]NDI36039.1 iron ABC transporter permease [Chengkuizengella sediminis]
MIFVSKHLKKQWIVLFFILNLLFLLFILSIKLGVYITQWNDIMSSFSDFNGSNEHVIIRDVRFPRALIAACVGASLGIAGALLQILTQNPLADTGILGVNGGASLLVVIAVSMFSISSLSQFTWIAFLGAAIFGTLVYILGQTTKTNHSPIRLTLAGAAVAAFTTSLTHAFLIINASALDEVLFWISGSIAGRSMDMLREVFPYMCIGWIGSIIIAKKIDALQLGEDVAKSLGQNTVWVKLSIGLLIIILAGSSVSIAGPISFVGLVIPHMARFFVGLNSRWVIIFSGLLGACLLLLADIISRLIGMPQEIPIGVTTAIIGVPFFIYIVRKGRMQS